MFIWPLLILLFISSSALVVGYVGCFSIVQSSRQPTAPVIWLGTEAALSLVRVVFWAWNPVQDDAEPMKFYFDLDPFPPLPTCNIYSDHIDLKKDLPVVRSPKFLRSITAYAGPIDRFDNPDISLYYTLTRKEPLLGVLYAPRKLYITLYDYKAGTTRVFYKDKNVEHFYVADHLALDPTSSILKTQLQHKIEVRGDSIMGSPDCTTRFISHYESILRTMEEKDVKGHNKVKVPNNWTLMIDGSECAISDNDKPVHNNGCKTDLMYIKYGTLERKTMEPLFINRGQYITICMSWVRRCIEEELAKCSDVSKITKSEVQAIQMLFIEAFQEMVCMFIVECRVRECLLWRRYEEIKNDIKIETQYEAQVFNDLERDRKRNLTMRHLKEQDGMCKRVKNQKDHLWTDLRIKVSHIALDEEWTNQKFKNLTDCITTMWKEAQTTEFHSFSISGALKSHDKRLVSFLEAQTQSMKTGSLGCAGALQKTMKDRLLKEWEEMKTTIKKDTSAFEMTNTPTRRTFPLPTV
jgi:hypothetical protein